MFARAALLVLALASALSSAAAQDEMYDLVIRNGRVIDPETQLDAQRNIGVTGGKIATVTADAIKGRKEIDATGLVVGPGFVDLHVHAINLPSFWMQAHDGVTTALELEAGGFPIKKAYAQAEAQRLPLNYGFAASWASARLVVADGVKDLDGTFAKAASYFGFPKWSKLLPKDKSDEVVRLIENELLDGGLGVGVMTGYAPLTNREEYVAIGNLAAKYDVATFNHLRAKNTEEPNGAVEGFLEAIGIAAATGSRFHIAHINSTALKKINDAVAMVEKAQGVKLRITTEAYPWGAGSTVIGTPFLQPKQLPQLGLTSTDLMYVATGERVQSNERLAELQKKDPGGLVVIHYLDETKPEDMAFIDDAVLFGDTMIASDAVPYQIGPRYVTQDVWPIPEAAFAHPRSAASYATVIARYVRGGRMTLLDLFRRSSLLPANMLSPASPAAKAKGRIQPGADADIIMFDLARVMPRATYANPRRPSEGMVHVMVNGQFVIENGALDRAARPGRPIASALSRK